VESLLGWPHRGLKTVADRQAAIRPTPAELKEIIAAERTVNPFLVWRTDEGRQRLLVLEPDRWRVTIGRDLGADIPLSWDREVSRAHALLERIGQRWTLVDDGLSRHGSFVNGSQVPGRRQLVDRDRLCFGSTEITFREAAIAGADATASIAVSVEQLALSPMQRNVAIALCRPIRESESALPATNRAIADEVFLSVDAVKAHLRVLFTRYGLNDLPQNEKRVRLAATILASGALSPRDF
jgi:pSer/pThr/pTyr-binding forkhead associated (FHA) protein